MEFEFSAAHFARIQMTHQAAEALGRPYPQGIDRFELLDLQIAKIHGVKCEIPAKLERIELSKIIQMKIITLQNYVANTDSIHPNAKRLHRSWRRLVARYSLTTVKVKLWPGAS